MNDLSDDFFKFYSLIIRRYLWRLDMIKEFIKVHILRPFTQDRPKKIDRD